MKKLRRNKKGQYSDRLNRSQEDWERGRGARRISNPNYMPKILNGKKTYVLRNQEQEENSLYNFNDKSYFRI